MNISDYLSKQLQSGEELVQVVRRHPATMMPSVGSGAVLILLDFFFIAWWFRHHQWGVIGFLVLLVAGIILIIRGVYLWSNNVLAVTSKRVIDIDQAGLFERNVSEATFEKVQDVRYTIRGFWPTIFRFGTIVVQTAGSTTNLELDAVQRPVELQRLIADLQHEVQAKKSSDVTATELLGVVDRLKAELGEDGVARLLKKSSSTIHVQDEE